MPGLQVVKGSHASWCHCVPLHYHEAWVSQHHVLPSSCRDGLDAACRQPVGFSQASSLLARLADALLLLPLPPSRSAHAGPVPQLLAHRAAAAWQTGKEGPAPWPCQTIICPVTLPQDCFQLLLGMGEAVCFLPIFPTLFQKKNCTGRGAWGQAGILKPRVPALLQGLRGVLCHSAPPQRLQG